MKATHPDEPGPHPDEESAGNWLAAAEAADHATIRAREEEEALARKHSRPTRILGWLVIGGILLEALGAIFAQGVSLGGPLFLVAGIMILKGSQAWVRFVAFFAGAFVLLTLIGELTLPLAMGQPVIWKEGWYSYGDTGFWMFVICPAAYLLAEVVLAFIVLRHRQLPYWTRTVKIATLVFGAIFLIQGSLALTRNLKNKELLRRFPAETRKAEDYFKVHGATLFATPPPDAEKLMSFPVIHSVILSTRSRGGIILPTKKSPVPPAQIRKATHYVKLPSGEWGKLEIGFIVDEAS